MPPRMHAGKLRHEITIYRMDARRDFDTGAELPPVWTPVAEAVPAAIEAMESSESSGEGVYTGRPFLISFRGCVALSEKNRIGWGGRWFNVVGLVADTVEEWTHAKVTEELKEPKP